MKIKMSNRIASIILSLAMLFTLTAGLDLSAYANISGDFEYEILEDGNIEIIGYLGNDRILNVPSVINNRKVYSVSFTDNDTVKIMNISKGIAILGFIGSFYALEEINIPSSVISVCEEDYAESGETCGIFYDCSSLMRINVDEKNNYYTAINNVLYNKDKSCLLRYPGSKTDKVYTIPNTVKSIFPHSFMDCKYLENLICNSGLKKISGFAIEHCKSLKSISLPNSLEESYGFIYDCPLLTDIYYAGSFEQWKKFRDNSGYDDYYADPNDYITFLFRNEQFVNMHYNSAGVCGYYDLNGYEYYNDYILYTSVYNSFLKGTNPPANNVFEPARAIDRAMMVTILYRMAGEPYANGGNPYTSSPFTDITNTSVYYYDAACWALKNGVTTETTFKPFNNVTREQTATFLYRYAQDNDKLCDADYKNVNLNAYHDGNSISHFAVDAMKWANYNSMITGTEQGYANPQGATQRIHATKILYGFGKTCNIGNFA